MCTPYFRTLSAAALYVLLVGSGCDDMGLDYVEPCQTGKCVTSAAPKRDRIVEVNNGLTTVTVEAEGKGEILGVERKYSERPTLELKLTSKTPNTLPRVEDENDIVLGGLSISDGGKFEENVRDECRRDEANWGLSYLVNGQPVTGSMKNREFIMTYPEGDWFIGCSTPDSSKVAFNGRASVIWAECVENGEVGRNNCPILSGLRVPNVLTEAGGTNPQSTNETVALKTLANVKIASIPEPHYVRFDTTQVCPTATKSSENSAAAQCIITVTPIWSDGARASTDVPANPALSCSVTAINSATCTQNSVSKLSSASPSATSSRSTYTCPGAVSSWDKITTCTWSNPSPTWVDPNGATQSLPLTPPAISFTPKAPISGNPWQLPVDVAVVNQVLTINGLTTVTTTDNCVTTVLSKSTSVGGNGTANCDITFRKTCNSGSTDSKQSQTFAITTNAPASRNMECQTIGVVMSGCSPIAQGTSCTYSCEAGGTSETMTWSYGFVLPSITYEGVTEQCAAPSITLTPGQPVNKGGGVFELPMTATSGSWTKQLPGQISVSVPTPPCDPTASPKGCLEQVWVCLTPNLNNTPSVALLEVWSNGWNVKRGDTLSAAEAREMNWAHEFSVAAKNEQWWPKRDSKGNLTRLGKSALASTFNCVSRRMPSDPNATSGSSNVNTDDTGAPANHRFDGSYTVYKWGGNDDGSSVAKSLMMPGASDDVFAPQRLK